MPDKQLMVNVYAPSTRAVPAVDGVLGPTSSVTTGPFTATVRPNGAGTITQWFPVGGGTINYQNVDEAVADELTTNNSVGSVSGLIDLYLANTAALPETAVVTQVEVFARLKSDGSSGNLVAIGVRSNGANNFTATPHNPTTSFANYSDVFALNPVTGQAWTYAEVNALEIGIDETFYNGTICYVTQMWFVVTYNIVITATSDGTPASPAIPSVPGPLLASWRDVSNLLTYRWGLNGGPESAELVLPRTFGNAGVPGDSSGIGDLRNGNRVECLAVDMDSQDGVMVYQGRQRRRRMSFRQGVTAITLLGAQSIQALEWIEGPVVFTDMDPSDMMRYLLDHSYMPGLTWDEDNPPAGFLASLTITRMRLGQAMESIRGLGGGTWFWRINPDQSLTFRSWDLSAAPDHVLMMDREVFDDVVFDDSQIETRKRVIVYGAPATPAIPATATEAAIPAREQVVVVAQAGDYDPDEPLDYPISNSRLTDTSTAQRIANGELAFRNREFFETTIPVADNNFAQAGLGYDIERIRPGDTLQISVPDFVFSFPKWDEVTWDDFEWDGPLFYATQMTFVVALIVYGFDHVLVTLQQLPLSMAQEYVNLSDRLLLQESA